MKRQMRVSFFYVIAIVLVVVALYFSESLKNMSGETYGTSDLIADAQEGLVEAVLIEQNNEVPTGEVTVYFKNSDRDTQSYAVSDVNKV